MRRTQPKTVPATNYMNVLHNWREQSCKKNMDWHSVNMGKKFTKQKKDAYMAGFFQGWSQALSTLKLHGYLIMKQTATNIYTGEESEITG